jgi:hypothetical protein
MRRLIPVLLLALPLAVGCSSDSTAPNSANSALLRIVHGSPDTSPLDIYNSGTLLVQGLPYASASSFYPFTTGANEFQVRTSGAVNLLLDISPSLAAGTAYTLALIGTGGALDSVLLTDDTTTVASGAVRLRLVQLAPLGPAMDLYVTAASDDIMNLTPTIAGVAYKSASPYVTPAAGSVRLRITQAGSKTVLVDSGTLSLTSGQVLSLFVFGKPGSGGGGAPYSAQLF